MIDANAREFVKLNYLQTSSAGSRSFTHCAHLDEAILNKYAEDVALQREYPSSIAHRNVPKQRGV
jgi:hypothetical protein